MDQGGSGLNNKQRAVGGKQKAVGSQLSAFNRRGEVI